MTAGWMGKFAVMSPVSATRKGEFMVTCQYDSTDWADEIMITCLPADRTGLSVDLAGSSESQ
jgi:hypothetical protein